MLGLDAAELDLIEQGITSGNLPHLARLREQGEFDTIATSAELFPGSVWPTFYRSESVAEHGLYHNILWNPHAMRFDSVNRSWKSEQPFWHDINQDHRIAIADIPMIFGSPRSLPGIHLTGWAMHDRMQKASYPDDLWDELVSTHGEPIMGSEPFEPQSVTDLVSMGDRLRKATDQFGDVLVDLYEREPWDLFLAAVGTPHRAGHYFWAPEKYCTDEPTDTQRQQLSSTLTNVYASCDRAVGRLIDRAPANSRIILFSLHGMKENPVWQHRLPDLINQIEGQGTATAAGGGGGWVGTIRQYIPYQLVYRFKQALPKMLRDPIMTTWYDQVFDWDSTRVFTLTGDHIGLLRVNLKGREPEGIIHPDEEYNTLLTHIEDGLLDFSDSQTGQPIVDRVVRQQDAFDAEASNRHLLPDLFVHWNDDVPARKVRKVESQQHGNLSWPQPSVSPSGRSGEHRARAWCCATGPGIDQETLSDVHHITDLVPHLLPEFN